MNRPGDPPDEPPHHPATPPSSRDKPRNKTRDETRDKTTVLDRIGPTVVRRRVYEPAAAHAARTLVHVPLAVTDDDDDSGPPSSVNVARALASLRGDELRRLEEIVSADDDPESVRAFGAASTKQPKPESVRAPLPAAPAQPTLRVGLTITIADLAMGLGIPKQELVTALVTHGFFDVTVKTVLPRDTARMAATMFGWAVEDDDTIVESAVQSKPKKKSHAAAPSSAGASGASGSAGSASAQSKPKSSAPKKPTKQRSVHRGR